LTRIGPHSIKLARLGAVVGLIAITTIGFATVASAAGGGGPFSVTIAKSCLYPGQGQTVTVAPGWEAMNITITYPNGTKQTVDPVRAAGVQVATWTIGSNAPAGLATVLITAFIGPPGPEGSAGIARAIGQFNIGVTGQACTPPPDLGPIQGVFVGLPAAPAPIKKVCDPGVTGTAVFSLSATTPRDLITLKLPASMNLSVACNGAAARITGLSTGVVVTLHEVSLPSGAAAAADTPVTMIGGDYYGTPAPTVTIRNAVAPAAVSPTPSPTPLVRLAQTGHAMPAALASPWLALLLGVLMVSIVGWVVATARRNRQS
jgi:hypothetical protein